MDKIRSGVFVFIGLLTVTIGARPGKAESPPTSVSAGLEDMVKSTRTELRRWKEDNLRLG